MINVYIKSFARPFYLDRCIRSIKFNLTGFDRIVVLDDGTLITHIEMLKLIHPDVHFRFSGADDGKIALLRERRFDEISKHYPSAVQFWIKEIEADQNDYFFLIEDDAWVTRRIDLSLMVANLNSNEAVVCKFWWGNISHDISARLDCQTSASIEYFIPRYAKLAEAASIWIVAFAVFRRDYWLNSVSRARRLGDERSQLIAAAEFAHSHPTATFAKTVRRSVHQGWIIPGRSTPEYYERGLIQHEYMDALNDAWSQDNLNPWEGYPYDFPVDYIKSMLSLRLPSEKVQIWQEWHRREVVYYYD